MRITLTIDKALVNEARELSGVEDLSALVSEGLRVFLAGESSRRLARLGGSSPDLASIPRRRST